MNNDSPVGTQSEEKPKKMTRAEFMVAFDEMNAELQKNIAEARESQARTKLSREKSEKLGKETREILRTLRCGQNSFPSRQASFKSAVF